MVVVEVVAVVAEAMEVGAMEVGAMEEAMEEEATVVEATEVTHTGLMAVAAGLVEAGDGSDILTDGMRILILTTTNTLDMPSHVR